MTTTRPTLAGLALLLTTGAAALAQDNPDTVGVSVEGTVIEVPIDIAAEACGLDAEALRAEWASLGEEVGTMADTSVNADATDLAPEVAVDTPMDAAIDGVTVTDGADASHGTSGGAAADIASDAQSGTASADSGAMLDEEAALEPAGDGPATPTEGTFLSKAAVCEVSQDTATALGIGAP